MINLN